MPLTRQTTDKRKQEERLQNAGQVMTEILNIPDNIPQDLLDKTKCIVVIPSVLKATDFVFLIMNERGATSLLRSKVKLGGDASVAAGPVGRQAEADTDVTMRAEILTYSRSRGLFAGVSLEGSTLRPDNDANEALYGQKIRASDIVLGSAPITPAAAHTLIAVLDKASPHAKTA
jgi:lipid-binding SYLF domain-containing protein